MSVMIINPNYCVTLGHDNFPNYFLGDISRVKKPVFRNAGSMAALFEFDKIACAHPQVVDMPAFKNVPEILAEQ